METTVWFVYIAECADKKFYVGIAKDALERIKVHNAGKGGRFTKYRTPLRLIYSEAVSAYSLARKRETELKGFSRRKKLQLIENKDPSGCGPQDQNFSAKNFDPIV